MEHQEVSRVSGVFQVLEVLEVLSAALVVAPPASSWAEVDPHRASPLGLLADGTESEAEIGVGM